MSAPDSHECAVCGGDLKLTEVAGRQRARCQECESDFPIEWDMETDSEGTTYTWSRDGLQPIEVPL